MRKIIFVSLFYYSTAISAEPAPSESEVNETLVQTMEISRRITANGMSYQLLKRCGADAEQLGKIRSYLYNDIQEASQRNPAANVDVDALFEAAFPSADEFYETSKNDPKLCEAMLDEAKKYVGH